MVEVLHYIHEHICERLSAGETAKKFGYSKWYFSEKFKKYTGVTFVEYVRHYRIQLAAFDILAGRKVTDVALDYGYETVGGFNKAFLSEYGCLPREYRQQAKASQLYYERRKCNMIPLTDRCAMLRDEAVNKKSKMYQYFAQREVYYTLGASEATEKGLSNAEIVAEGIAATIERFRPFIAPGELVVGFNFGDAHLGEWSFPPNNPDGRKMLTENGIPEAEAARYFTYKANPAQGGHYLPPAEFTQEEQQALQEWAAIGRCIDSNHSVINYEKVLRKGFDGILQEIDSWIDKNGENDLYRAARRICVAACTIGEKYAAAAKELLAEAEYNEADLLQIQSVCEQVPRYPAQNFAQAVQSLLFAHIINTWEDTINANSLGRLDQILYPYYRRDIDSGVLTKEQAFELVCCLWIKLYRDYDVQQSCVGGTSADGSSDVNELSYMMLDVTERLDFVRCLSVRFSHNTEHAFLKRALEVVGHLQKGIPFFFNDDVMIPALISKGIDPADAVDYTQIGCVETVIPGKSNPHAVTGETNLLKAMEYVLCNGRSMMFPDFAPGVQTGALSDFKSYDDLYNAVIQQMERILDLTCSMVKKCRDVSEVNVCRPYKALLTDGCLESGKDFNAAGAKYDYYQVMLGGVPNLADSLIAIKKYVYEERKYTLAQVKEMLENDWPDEATRYLFMKKAPKFGNDFDEVDMLAADIIRQCCDILDRLSVKYNLSFHAQPFTFLWMVQHGMTSAASADGRHKGEIIAYSMSPMQGRDFQGLTACLNSICKLPTERTPGTTSAIVEVDPKLFTDANIDLLTNMLAAAGKQGLSNVQFNTIDAETLLDAQQNPEKYSNLAVRVSGFSQKFNLLSPELQDHIIGRTKHACL